MPEPAPEKHLLSDYITYGPNQSGVKSVMSVKILGEEMHLMVEAKQWPRELFLKHRLSLLFLFRDAIMGKEVEVDVREAVCLCFEIGTCPFKKAGDFHEKRDCSYYSYGVCISATRWANQDRILSMSVLGVLRGATRQRVNQVLKRDYQHLYQVLSENPIIREILEEIYQNKELSQDEIIAKLMGNPEEIEEEEGPDFVTNPKAIPEV